MKPDNGKRTSYFKLSTVLKYCMKMDIHKTQKKLSTINLKNGYIKSKALYICYVAKDRRGVYKLKFLASVS